MPSVKTSSRARHTRKGVGQSKRRPTPLISVIVPTFNCDEYLSQAVQSVLDQTFRDFEIIVVDDGSTDGTHKLVKKLGDDVKYVRQEHLGNAAARNRGIVEAAGQWLCFLDSDDLWEPRKLEFQLNHMLSHAGLKVNFPGGRRFFDSGEVRDMPAGPDEPAQLWSWLARFQPFGSSLSGVMVHRSCFDEVGVYDENLKLSVDWDMWIRLAARFELAWFSDVLVHVRVHPGGANRNAELRLHMYLKCLRKHRKFFCNDRGMRRQWAESFGARLQRLGRYLLKQGRYHQAWPRLLQSLRFGYAHDRPAKLKLLLECLLRDWGLWPIVERLRRRKHRFF